MSIQIQPDGLAIFDHLTAELPSLLERLLEAPAVPASAHGKPPAIAAIYLFSKDDHPIYVGQTRNLRRRLGEHTNPLAKNNKASFAFNLAKEVAKDAGVDIARYRAQLEADEEFAGHFTAAKSRVSEMDVRFLGLEDPITRSVLEIYASLTLDTMVFNKFETH